MNKLSKEKRDKLLLVGVATLAVLAVLYFFVISAQQSALRECVEKTEATKESLAKAERWMRMAPGIEARLSSSRKELEAKQETMAPVDKFKWFYNTLEQFMTQHQVKLVDITREPEISDVGVLPKFPFQAAIFGVKLRAYYHDFGAFLADFENRYPFMRVQNVELASENGARSGMKELMAAAAKPGATDNRSQNTERLAITMRVVTLIKPGASL